MKQHIKNFTNRMFVCHVNPEYRMLRGSMGVLVNLIVIALMDFISPIVFWSLVIASYGMLIEALSGCTILHWVKRATKNKTACKNCEQEGK